MTRILQLLAPWRDREGRQHAAGDIVACSLEDGERLVALQLAGDAPSELPYRADRGPQRHAFEFTHPRTPRPS